MWLILAFVSATLLGLYDVCKKQALRHYQVNTVLFINTLCCSLICLPIALQIPSGGWDVQRHILLKACIVLTSWLLGYYGMKHLPLTLVGPINATRPVMVLLGAVLVFGERLNVYQWAGVTLAICSFFLLSKTSKKEGIHFFHNRWIVCIVGAAVMGAISGLYDKHLLAPASAGGLGLNRLAVQSYYNFYQCAMMGLILLLRSESRWPLVTLRSWSKIQWGWGWLPIILVSIFLTAADFVYFYGLSMDGAMISVMSMVRRSNVLVSFTVGAFLFHEKNLQSKAIDLALVLISMIFLYIGSK